MPPSSATAYQSLTAFKPRDTKDVMAEAESKFQIPERTKRLSSLRGLVSNLESAVEAVDPSVTGRTSGTFTTEGQRQALVSRERAPILTDLGKQNRALGNETADFTTSQGLAAQMASALLTQDQQTYSRLLDQYNAAITAEREAEAKRQFEESLRLQREQIAATKAAASGGGYDLSNFSSASNAAASLGDPVAAQSQKNQEAAYVSVQKFIRAGKAAAQSDYNATLNSANRGNVIDKLKIQMYNQAHPDWFNTSAPGKSFNIFTDEGASNLGNAVRNKASGFASSVANRLKSNFGIFR